MSSVSTPTASPAEGFTDAGLTADLLQDPGAFLREAALSVESFMWAPLAVAAALAALLLTVPVLRRGWPLLALNLIGCVLIYRGDLPGFVLANGVLFLASRLLLRMPADDPAGRMRRWRAAGWVLALIVLVFLAGRRLGFEAWALGITRLEGCFFASPAADGAIRLYVLDMWLFLRVVSYLWEVGAGRLRDTRALPFLLWASLPFTTFGPLLRPSEMEPDLARRGGAIEEAGHGRRVLGEPAWWGRLAGRLGQMLCAGALAWLQVQIYSAGSPPLWQKLLVWFGTGPWAFYLGHAGFFGAMECLGRAAGFQLQPSFRFPFFRRNLSDFWANWNMTVTRLIRDYLFYSRWGLSRPNVYLNTVIVFAAVGLWHGANAYWLLWGLLHGVAFSLTIWYTKVLLVKLPWLGRLLPDPLSRVLTYLFVCSCWILPSKILQILGV